MKKVEYTREELLLFARVVEEGVWQCMLRAWENCDDEKEAGKWFAQADRFETKFKTDYGVHYTAITNPDFKVFYT